MATVAKDECHSDNSIGSHQHADTIAISMKHGTGAGSTPSSFTHSAHIQATIGQIFHDKLQNKSDDCDILLSTRDIMASSIDSSFSCSPALAGEAWAVAKETDDLDDTESVTSLDQSMDSSRSQTPVIPSISGDKPPCKKKKRFSRRSKHNPDALSEGEQMEEIGEHSSMAKKRIKKVRKHCDTCPLYMREVQKAQQLKDKAKETVNAKDIDNTNDKTIANDNTNENVHKGDSQTVPDNNSNVPNTVLPIREHKSSDKTKGDLEIDVPKDVNEEKQLGDISATSSASQNTEKRRRKKRLVCTCKHRKKRPEPEGGCGIPPRFMDEYDRIIYCNDPIFSDVEDNPQMDERINQEMVRFHKRHNGHQTDIFQTAHMVTSNTMLRFAIIGTELQNIRRVLLRRVIFLIFSLLPC